MKLAVALSVVVGLAACSSPGLSGAPLTPGAIPGSLVQRAAGKMKLTGYYLVPSFGAVDIYGLADGPGGIWFTEFEGGSIGKMTTAGVVTTFNAPAGAQLNGIVSSHSPKRIWTGGYGGMIVELTPAGAQHAFPIAGAHIESVVRGHDKNIWFTDYGNKKIGRITAAGVVTEFALPPGGSPGDITVGPDGNFWITNVARNKIVKMSPSGVALASYGRNLAPHENLNDIVAAPDGNLYFSQYANDIYIADKIGRITTKGKITEIGTLPAQADPGHLIVGKDKNVYFGLGHLQAVGKIELAHAKVTFQYLPLTSDEGTDAIVNGRDGRLYLGGGYIIYAVSY